MNGHLRGPLACTNIHTLHTYLFHIGITLFDAHASDAQHGSAQRKRDEYGRCEPVVFMKHESVNVKALENLQKLKNNKNPRKSGFT